MDRFTLIRPVGEGATKEVFLARDEVLQRDVALCRFKAGVLSGSYLELVRREARLLAGLSHPNIVGLFDLVEAAECYLVMEYVDGGSLKSRLASDAGRPSRAELLTIAAEVCDALAATHARGIFHRDVKPGNVLLTAEGVAKLGDYGLARPIRDDWSSVQGLIAGTVAYMSPEQAKGLRPDSPSDMYSFGVMLYEMIAGRRPFDGEDVSVLVHHLESAPPPPTHFGADCPPELEKLVLALLDKDPRRRPDASETAARLRRIGAGGEPPAIAGKRVWRRGVRWPWPPRRRARVGLVGGVVAVVIAALAALAWWPREGPLALEQACAVDRGAAHEIVAGAATAADMLGLLKAANPGLVAHIEGLQRAWRDGEEHRGLSYAWGAPGIGKSFFARELIDGFDGPSCLVKLGRLFGDETDRLEFAVAARVDLASIDGAITFNTLPAIADERAFDLAGLLAAAGCRRDDGWAPLIVIDDIDEIHASSAIRLLAAMDRFVLLEAAAAGPFVHLFAFGRPEGFAGWFLSPSRVGETVAPLLNGFAMQGPRYRVLGDLELLAHDRFVYVLGRDTWQRRVAEGGAEEPVRAYVDYVRRHPFLVYSIRSLSLSRMITERSQVERADGEVELKAFLFEHLLRRATATHGRPGADEPGYTRLLEAAAARYTRASAIDAQGFFTVGADDRVAIEFEDGRSVAVRVRDLLDRSGIAVTMPAAHSVSRYRFEPAWILSHLIERANQRRFPSYRARGCY